MRVIYLTQYFNLPDQPGSGRAYGLASRLVEMGHEVHMISTDRIATGTTKKDTWRTSVEAGIHVHWTPIPYSNRMRYSARMIAFLQFAYRASIRARKLTGDVVFATSTPLTIAIPAIIVSRLGKIPMVFEVRDLWPDVPIALGAIKNPISRFLARKLEAAAYRNSKEVVALAPGMGEAVAARGIAQERITIIPNGADRRIFAPDIKGASTIRQQHAWLGNKKLILYCGALGRVNGVSWLADVAAAICDLDMDINIAIVGDGVEREKVLSRAETLGVLNRNFHMIGRVSKQESASWLSEADMTVALFTGPPIVWKDATQNKFFDSLAAGKPVISNFDGWQCQIAREHEVGFTVSATDFKSAAKEIVEKIHDQDWMSQASQTAIKLADGAYSMDRHAARLNEVLVRATNN